MSHVVADIAAYRQQLARRWLRLGLLAEDTAARLVAASPALRPRRSLAVRIAMLLGTLLGGWGLIGSVIALVAFDDEEHARIVFFLAALGSMGLGLVAVIGLQRFCEGVDDGLWLLFVTAAAAFAGLQFEDAAETWRYVLAAVALAALLPAGLGYLLGALLAWTACTWLLADLLDLGTVSALQALLVAAATLLRRRVRWHRRLRQAAALSVVALLAAYLCWNPWVIRLFTDEPPEWWLSLAYPPAEWCAIASWGIPCVFLAWGLLRRDRVALDVGLASGVLALLTLPVGRWQVPVEIALVVAGAVVIGVVLLARAALARDAVTARTGFTEEHRVAAIPRGWTREDIESNEGWVNQLLAGLQRRGAGVREEPGEARPKKERS